MGLVRRVGTGDPAVNIIESKTFQIGPYVIRQRPRSDSPGWGQYLVFLGDVLIGKSFSMPSESDCQWLETQQRGQTFYAYSSAKLKDVTGLRRLKRIMRRRITPTPEEVT